MAADQPTDRVLEAAPAKVNLYLHVTGQRADGYHLLDSVAVFPGIGDRIHAERSTGLSLSVDGPFGDLLSADGDNLVLRAALQLAEAHGLPAHAALRLDKNLPVASGIGGGSADAAATLRALARLWNVPVPQDLALGLGADVPVCLRPRCQRMEGVGEVLTTVEDLPPAWMLLVNPMQAVPTGAVFEGLSSKTNDPAPEMPRLKSFRDLIEWLRPLRNDLQEPATALCPAIGEVLAALDQTPLPRMSGSGATCFTLFPDQKQADAAASRLRHERPGWWIAVAPIEERRRARLSLV